MLLITAQAADFLIDGM